MNFQNAVIENSTIYIRDNNVNSEPSSTTPQETSTSMGSAQPRVQSNLTPESQLFLERSNRQSLESILRPHYSYLCESTADPLRLTLILYGKGAISKYQLNQIKAAVLDTDKLDLLYGFIVPKEKKEELLMAWDQSENNHIVKYLNSHLK